MNSANRGKERDAGKASHGPRSEVTWEGGSGRQPYGNQGPEEAAEPNSADEFAPAGNRSSHSGQNQDQLHKVKRRP